MNIEVFVDTPFDDEQAFKDFLGTHEVAHQSLANAVFRLGKSIASVPLSDSPRGNKDWMLDHYSIHLSLGDSVNQSVPDLASSDLNIESQYLDWMQYHADVHRYLNQALGL